LKFLIESYYTANKSINRELKDIKYSKLYIINALEILNSYKVNEVKSNGQADNTLVGLLQLINIMLTNESPELLTNDERQLVL
jgi:hypothetical protein